MLQWLKRLFKKPPVPPKIRDSWVMSRCGPAGETLTFTRPGEAGRRHYITSIHPSFNQHHTGYLTLLDGYRQRKGEWYVHASDQIPLHHPIGFEDGAEFRVTLSPGLGMDSALVPCLTVVGYTEDV